MATVPPVTVEVSKLRTSGLQLVEGSDYLLQSFGVAKTKTKNQCSTVDLLESQNMQALKEPEAGWYDADPSPGPYASASYQSRSVITDGELEFSGNEQLSSIFCDDDDPTNPINCDELILV